MLAQMVSHCVPEYTNYVLLHYSYTGFYMLKHDEIHLFT